MTETKFNCALLIPDLSDNNGLSVVWPSASFGRTTSVVRDDLN
jgi:hypothetical protein